jgi:hypothetical protein
MRKVLIIPANSSSASVIDFLKLSEGIGIFFETEADTLAASFKQDWANYSDMLRKAFQHEPISYSRKANNEFIELPMPRLSVAISGTLSQVKGIFPSAENGLVSRFMFYAFNADSKWRDVSPSEQFNLGEKFNQFSNEVIDIHEYLKLSPTEVILSEKQWKTLNDQFDAWLTYFSNVEGDVAGSIIKRLGLIAFRIMMVLSALRLAERKDNNGVIECTDEDFNTSINIVSVLKEHSMFVLELIPESELSDRDKNVRIFLDSLPKGKFARNRAVQIGAKNGLKPRTIDKYLNKLLKANQLKNVAYGFYEKIGK